MFFLYRVCYAGSITRSFKIMENPMPANDETVTLSIFPALAGKKAGYIDMNACAERMKQRPAGSRFLDADLTDRALRRLHHRRRVAYSLGGYLEDRKTLWRGTYLKPDSAVHLGIDVNV